MSDDPLEFLHRAELVNLQMKRIRRRADRAAAAGDEIRVAACRDEMDVLVEAMETIREEQLLSMLPKPKRKKWWQRRVGA